LIQRLHRRQPRRAAPVGFLVFALVLALGRLLLLFVVVLCHDQIRVQPAFDSQHGQCRARGRRRPCELAGAPPRAQACASVLTVMMPLRAGIRFAHRVGPSGT